MTENILNFGKHRGEAVASLVESDPHYLKWLRWQRWIPPEISEEANRLVILSQKQNSDAIADLGRWNEHDER
jgi:hypothetical protein